MRELLAAIAQQNCAIASWFAAAHRPKEAAHQIEHAAKALTERSQITGSGHEG
jgi:hypothetical protein